MMHFDGAPKPPKDIYICHFGRFALRRFRQVSAAIRRVSAVFRQRFGGPLPKRYFGGF